MNPLVDELRYGACVLSLIIALGESDCEGVGRGILAQPINAVSSLAFTVVALLMVPYVSRANGFERSLRTAFVTALAATGIGSFLYHGPQTVGSQYLHDITFLLALAVIAAASGWAGLRWTPRSVWVGLGSLFVVLTAVLLLAPGVTNVFAGVLVLAVAATHVVLHRMHAPDRSWSIAAAVAMVLALVFFLIGRTGGPLCESGSWFQGHALWHVFSALALAAYFIAMGTAREAVRS